MADTKKEHFVPRFYLENFENDNKRIHVFDKKIMKTRCQKKEEIAHENYFYDVEYEKILSSESPEELEKLKNDLKEITGIDDWDTIAATILNPKHIEKDFLGRIESEYSPLLKKIIAKSYNGNQWVIDNCAPFSEVEKAHLAFFMAIQIIRTKTFRDTFTQTFEKTVQTLLYKQQMGNEDALPKEYFDVQANKDYIKLQHLSMLLDEESTIHIADTLLKHNWVMYVNKTDNPFYTSDTPIIPIPHKKNKYITYSGLNSEGIEIVFPLSPKLLIALYDTKWHSLVHHDRTFEIINHKEQVDYYNQNQVAHCFRCIFSKSDNFDLAKDLCKKYPLIRDSDNRISVG
ncbi:MAG: DUF4238 domain-containing protein [Lachnospiraceae bacterium]|nr:DUF4238 domain-containing protein [Lachnospiraceae bacterium]